LTLLGKYHLLVNTMFTVQNSFMAYYVDRSLEIWQLDVEHVNSWGMTQLRMDDQEINVVG